MTYVADSLIGADTCIEAGAQLWNWRPSSDPLYLGTNSERVQVPSHKFGAIVGDKVVIGVNASIYPATRIGENSVISAGCIVNEDIPPNSEVSAVQKIKITERKGENNC